MNRFHTSGSSGPPPTTQNSCCVHRDLTLGPSRTQNSFCVLRWSSSSISLRILGSYSSKASGPPTTQKVPFCLSSADPMNLFLVLHFAAAIASADPGPSTSGAYTMHPIPARPHRLVGPLQLSIRVKGKHSRPFLQGSVLKRPPLRVLRLLATTSVDP